MRKGFALRYFGTMGALVGAAATAAQLLPMVKVWVWWSILGAAGIPVLFWARARSRARQLPHDWLEHDTENHLEVPASNSMLVAACNYGRLVYGQDALSIDGFKAWKDANPWSIAVMRDRRGHYLGHFDVLPLTDTAAKALVSGNLLEGDLRRDHILPESTMQEANYLYLAGLTVCADQAKGNDQGLAAQLIGGLAKYVQAIYGDRDRPRQLLAIAATEDGKHLLTHPTTPTKLVRPPEGRSHAIYSLMLTPDLFKSVLARARRRAPPAELPRGLTPSPRTGR